MEYIKLTNKKLKDTTLKMLDALIESAKKKYSMMQWKMNRTSLEAGLSVTH